MLKNNVVYQNVVVYVDRKTFSIIFRYFDSRILGFGEWHKLSGFVVMAVGYHRGYVFLWVIASKYTIF